ncbi:hypothetical protein DL98DRAFT_517409 [Cadophora sp. DSE1049]|nr:hypothetical protein DL98DRAFT_517409 [Cadophora sp. DSE1049]
MAETNKDAFCIYGIWLEMGEIQVERVLGLSALLRTSVYVGNEESIGKEWVKMAKLELLLECYILGDYLQAPFGFQDRVMSHVIEAFGDVYAWSDGKVPLGNLRDIWEKTYPGTPPRDLIIDMLSSCLSKATISDAFKLGILCEDMITAVKERLKSHIRDGTTAAPPWNTYSSRYFMYARSSPAPSTMKKNGLIVAVLPYWDVEGSELRLPDGSKW